MLQPHEILADMASATGRPSFQVVQALRCDRRTAMNAKQPGHCQLHTRRLFLYRTLAQTIEFNSTGLRQADPDTRYGSVSSAVPHGGRPVPHHTHTPHTLVQGEGTAQQDRSASGSGQPRRSWSVAEFMS